MRRALNSVISSAPFTMMSSSVKIVAHVITGPPDDFWQLLQWQYITSCGLSDLTSNCTAPHRHLRDGVAGKYRRPVVAEVEKWSHAFSQHAAGAANLIRATLTSPE